jgi:dihydropteroate synthase
MPGYTVLSTRCGELPFDRTRIMGIVNVTPDSFSDGGSFESVEAAVEHGVKLVAAGADILDVGGESTRPGASPVAAEDELARVVPVVEALRQAVDVPISIDTYKAAVAQAAVAAGADIVNDVSALRGDPEMVRFVGSEKLPVVLMHALWPPATMQESPEYVDVVEDVASFLEDRARYAMAFGVPREGIIIDPGIGFGKTTDHNLTLLRETPRFLALGYGVLVGPSRKRFIGELTGRTAKERMAGTIGAVAVCAASGANIVRVHDVEAIRDAVRVVDAIVWQV